MGDKLGLFEQYSDNEPSLLHERSPPYKIRHDKVAKTNVFPSQRNIVVEFFHNSSSTFDNNELGH